MTNKNQEPASVITEEQAYKNVRKAEDALRCAMNKWRGAHRSVDKAITEWGLARIALHVAENQLHEIKMKRIGLLK